MSAEIRFSKTWVIAFGLLTTSAVWLTPAYAQATKAKSLGLESPSKPMNVHVMLNLRNQSQLQSLIKDIQDTNSPNYHKFLTKQQFAAQFAPTASDSKKVADYLTANGLKVTHIDSHNLVVSATGTVDTIQKTFNIQIEKVQADGQTFNRPMTPPTLAPSIAPLVKTVGGLHTLKPQFYIARPTSFKNKKPVPLAPVKFTKSKPNGAFFPGDCFSNSNDILNLVGAGLQAIYSGNQYPDATCGYSPAEMQHAYGFDTVIKSGLDGTGQVITIVDPYGSYSILTDANTFSATYGLPKLVPGVNFNLIYNPDGTTPDCVVGPTTQCGAEYEVTLDVEWAHAMAPGATIDLVTTATFNFDDIWATDFWIAQNLPTGSVSHSFGAPESEVYDFDYPDYFAQYLVNAIAAGLGVSNNYSSGDSGDFYPYGDYPPYTDVSFPAGSPDATSIGGTSLALNSNGSYKWEEGWGTNITLIGYVPPFNIGFYFGAGGGTSSVTPAPLWQQGYLSNTWRQQPDVSMDADPYTGVEIIYTGDFNPGDPQYVTVIGGTSLSCPMFSAVWSIAGQKAGTPYLGNAAQYVYALAKNVPGSVRDVQPVGSGHNAHGTIFCSGLPCYNESQWDLAFPYQNSPVFYESIWSPGLYTVTFGTDSSLSTNKGWDNVTGVGTPNGANFINPF